MDLYDGLKKYKSDQTYWQLTLNTEFLARKVLLLLDKYGSQPNSEALDVAKELLLKIEEWKAMCLKQRMGNAVKNPKRTIWNSFHGALMAQDDISTIHSIMQLTGFGTSVDPGTGQRRAKAATAVLRFLDPENWGVVDWRSIAMRTRLKKCDGDVDLAISQDNIVDSNELRSLYDLVDEYAACDEVHQYRAMKSKPYLLRAADIDMALFGLSLLAWPIKKISW